MKEFSKQIPGVPKITAVNLFKRISISKHLSGTCYKSHHSGTTIIPRYPQEIGSEPLEIPKSLDAQVPHIKWRNTVSLPYPWVPQPQIH